MLIPQAPAEFEFTVKRSRFIALAIPVASPEEVRRLLGETRLAHPDSRHVVHAFITGQAREHQGLSDDGEPAGTAGKPVWEILKGRGITNVAVFVVRYFGGIKLGTGGLVKAYGDAAKGVLDLLPVEELIEKRRFTLGVTYSTYEGVVRKIRDHRGQIVEESFGTGVSLIGDVPADEAELLAREISDLTAGRGELTWQEEAASGDRVPEA